MNMSRLGLARPDFSDLKPFLCPQGFRQERNSNTTIQRNTQATDVVFAPPTSAAAAPRASFAEPFTVATTAAPIVLEMNSENASIHKLLHHPAVHGK